MDGNVQDTAPQMEETRTVRRRGLIAGAAALAAGLLSTRGAQPARAIDGDSLKMGLDSSTGNDLTNLAGRVTHVVAGYGQSGPTYTGNQFFIFDAAYVNLGTPQFNVEAIRAIGAGSRPGLVAMVEGTTVGTPSYAAVYATGTTTGDSNSLPSGAIGVYGLTTNHAGVRGNSTNYRGVWGSSNNGVGVYGESNNDTGVVGSGGASGGAGVKAFGGTGGGSGLVAIADGASDPGAAQGSAIYGRGTGTAHIGIRGDSGSGNGVQGTSSTSSGVLGISTSAVGVRGDSTGGIGIQGTSNSSSGVFGTSVSYRGVYGQIQSTSGAVGTIGVLGEHLGTGSGGIGVRGMSAIGLGGSFQGGQAPVRLVPGTASARTLSASGHQAGELYVTSDNRLFFFDGTNWREVVLAAPGSAIPPAAPARTTTQNNPQGTVQPAPSPRSG